MRFRSRFDKIALGTVFILAFFLLVMLTLGDFSQPRVQYFNGDQTEISPQIGQFLIRFNRLMNEKSVEEGFTIVPKVSGSFSWAGRTFAFTPTEPLLYGQSYTLILRGAEDRAGKKMLVTTLQTKTRDQSVVFLNEQGNILQVSIKDGNQNQLTNEQIFVQQFDLSPDGNFIAFLAQPRGSTSLQDKTHFQLYVMQLLDQTLIKLPLPQEIILDNLHWLPDASAVAFSYVDSTTSKEGLKIYDLNSQTISDLAAGKARAYDFYFTPDGSQVAYIDTNGALILGDMPDGNGALVATVFTEISGFSSRGDKLGYILPRTIDAFDLTNIPILVDSEGNEDRVPVPMGSTSFNVSFVPKQEKIVFSLEESLGNERKNTIYSYSYDKKELKKLVDNPDCTAEHPVASPDGSLVIWQCIHNEHKGYTVTGWNDYQGKMLVGEIWLTDLANGIEENLHIQGANVEFLP